MAPPLHGQAAEVAPESRGLGVSIWRFICVNDVFATRSLLWHAAQEFKEKMGAPAVVDVGDDSIWYDAGMAADLKKLYSLAVSPNRPVLRDILRELFNVPKV